MPFLSLSCAVEMAKELDFWHPKMRAMRLFKTNDTAVHAENIAVSQAWEPPLLIPTAHSLAVLDIKLHLQFLAKPRYSKSMSVMGLMHFYAAYDNARPLMEAKLWSR